MAGTHGPWWSPGSDSPHYLTEQDAEDAAREQESGPRMFFNAVLLVAAVLTLVTLACRAWAQEDDLTAARMKAFQQRLHEAPVARVDR